MSTGIEPYVEPIEPATGQRVRLVATDIDGTIVGASGRVSPRTAAALQAVEAAGARLVLVTGRPVRWIADLADDLGHFGTVVCANGAVVYDLHEERVGRVRAIDPGDGLHAVRRLRAVLARASFAAETVEGFVHDPAYVPRWDAGLGAEARVIEEVLMGDLPVLKLLCRDETSTGDAMLAAAGPALGGVVEVTHSNVADCLLEVSALGVNKGSTLAALAELWGVRPSECIAFGDMPNDIPMLQWAGTSYAMSDAHPLAAAAAGATAGPVEEDGVAEVLERLLAGDRIGGDVRR